MEKNYYNDENIFVLKDGIENSIEDKMVSIPIYWWVDESGEYHIDTETMREEFERTVYGIEVTIEEFQELDKN